MNSHTTLRRRITSVTAAAAVLLAAGCSLPARENSATGTSVSTPAPTSRGMQVIVPPVSPTTSGSSAATSSGSAPSSGSSGSTSSSSGAAGSGSAPPSSSTTASAPASTPDPAPVDGLSVTAEDRARAVAAVKKMTVAQRAGTVLMGNSGKVIGTSDVADLGLGGVILMGSNGILDGTTNGEPAEVAALTAGLRDQVDPTMSGFPLLIGTDQEFGVVTRLKNGFTRFPAAFDYTGADPATAVAMVRKASAVAGSEMLAVGINVDFAPVSDLLNDDAAAHDGSSAIGDRSYGSDPSLTGKMVAAAVEGYQSAGVAATLKHFPGIGGIATDTHEALPTLDLSCAQWNDGDSVPIRAGVKAGAALAMTGHVLMPAVGATETPASMSSVMVSDLLRGKGADGCTGLGFAGVSVTDSFEMAPIVDNYDSGEAAWRALAAGEDLVLMPADPTAARDGIVAAVADGSLDGARLTDAAVQVMSLRAALGRMKVPDISTVNSAAHQAVAAEVNSAIGR
ncbi:hypothetical protein D1871_01695 [Nakamurella silvestris]|nr:hypothetical protein D1871_01695 [Nakamurella silvestris]